MTLVAKDRWYFLGLAALCIGSLLVCVELFWRSRSHWLACQQLRGDADAFQVIEHKEQSLREFVLGLGDPRPIDGALAEYQARLAELEALYDAATASLDPELERGAKKLRLAHEQLRGIERRALAAGNDMDRALLSAPEYRSARERLRGRARSVITALQVRLREELARSGRLAQINACTALALAGLVVVAVAALQYVKDRTVRRTVSVAIGELERMADGDTHASLARFAKRNDEFGTVARVVQRLIESARHSEREARQAEQRYRAILEGAPDIICILNADGSVAYANPGFTRQTGWTMEDVRTGAFTNAVWLHPQDEIRLLDQIRRVCAGEDVPPTEFRGRHRDGHYMRLRESLSAVRDGDGNVVGAVVIANDVTAARKMEKDLERLSDLALAGALVRGSVAQFNNIVAAVHATAEAAIRGAEEQRFLPALRSVWRSASRATVLSRNLTTLFSQEELKKDLYTAEELLSISINFMANEFEGQGVQMDYRPEPAPPVLADPQLLQQAFTNIMGAMLFSILPGDNTMRVATKGSKGQVLITFLDNGPGIPEEDIRASSAFGSGLPEGSEERLFVVLGLSVARRIVAEHGGSIEFSNDPGRDWTVRVTLPATPGEPLSPAERLERLSQVGPKRVLVVEEAAVRTAIRDFLSREGHTVAACADARTALDELGRTAFDVVLCDFTAPGLSGARVLHSMLQMQPEVRVVALIGEITPEAAEEALRDGAFACLRKPFGMEDIREILQRIDRERQDERGNPVDG